MIRTSLFFIVIWATFYSYGQQERGARKLVKVIDLRTDVPVELLKKLVNINCGTIFNYRLGGELYSSTTYLGTRCNAYSYV